MSSVPEALSAPPSASSSSSSSASSSEEEEEDESSSSSPLMIPRSKHEVVVLPDEELDVEQEALSPETPVEPLGVLHNSVGSLLVLRAVEGRPPLGLDTVVCSLQRQIIGVVEEVMGPTAHPFYSVRKIKGCSVSLAPAELLYYVVARSCLAVASRSRGCDASDLWDEELPEHLLEFSDDEVESNVKRAQKRQRRSGGGGRNQDISKGSVSLPPARNIVRSQAPVARAPMLQANIGGGGTDGAILPLPTPQAGMQMGYQQQQMYFQQQQQQWLHYQQWQQYYQQLQQQQLQNPPPPPAASPPPSE